MLEIPAAIKTIGDWLLSLVKPRQEANFRLQEARRQERRRVREKLIPYNTVVHSIGCGNWPGSEWGSLLSEVGRLGLQVRESLDLDRATAGLDWCLQVEDCLDKGWKLAHHCFGMSGAARLGADYVTRLHENFDAVRDAYEQTHRRVTTE